MSDISYKRAIETCLREGFAPLRSSIPGSRGSAVREAARRLGENVNTLTSWVIAQERLAASGREHWLPDWTRFGHMEAVPIAVESAPPADPIEVRRLKDDVARLRRDLDSALRQAGAAQGLRASLFGLAQTMPEPVVFAAPKSVTASAAETVVLMANDWQWGESVALERMDGLNAFNVEIARKRAGRLFGAAVDLSTKHWSGPPPTRVILVIGGDMVSGEIHDELAKTNELLAIPALKDCAAALMGGINLILASLECPIDVIVIPGNHGRVTRKPESKLYVETSYDTLLGDILELHYRALGQDRVTFYTPASGDALFAIDGRMFLCTHGDRIGARGGQGFVGPAATVARGFKRLCADYQARGVIVDTILCGHFHVPLRLEEGYVSGTLVGPSEFARDGRFRPHPASQLFLAVHPRRGITQVREIYVGAADEGSLYRERKASAQRPQFRVKGIA